MAQIVLTDEERGRLDRFLDTQLDPATNPLIELLTEPLADWQWNYLHDVLRRRLEFLCTAWLAWLAIVDRARNSGMSHAATVSSHEIPAEIHELSLCYLPEQIVQAFDNSPAHREYTERWVRVVQDWAQDQEREFDLINVTALARDFHGLKQWLETHGVGDHQEPIENVLFEVFRELSDRAFDFVVQGLSFEDEAHLMLGRLD